MTMVNSGLKGLMCISVNIKCCFYVILLLVQHVNLDLFQCETGSLGPVAKVCNVPKYEHVSYW